MVLKIHFFKEDVFVLLVCLCMYVCEVKVRGQLPRVN